MIVLPSIAIPTTFLFLIFHMKMHIYQLTEAVKRLIQNLKEKNENTINQHVMEHLQALVTKHLKIRKYFSIYSFQCKRFMDDIC